MRRCEISRETKETKIRAAINLDGTGPGTSSTGVPFFDHMLGSMARHGGFDLMVHADGDLGIDSHHTVEDTGIVIGDAVKKALGEGRGIRRFSHAIVPMDEALAQVALDCGGRGYLVWNGSFAGQKIGNVEATLFEHFFYSLCMHAGITCHITVTGRNDHHKCEAVFKAFGIALGDATSVKTGSPDVPSTKGVL
jgi:imidazoleglycerol-phosphate dehydratase